MSAKSKGDAAERQVSSVLKSKGYLVMDSPRTMKRVFIHGRMVFVSQANDYFSYFDHCCKKGIETLWVQTKFKSSCNVSSAKKGIAEFAENYCSESEKCQIWLKVPRRGFVCYDYEPGIAVWSKTFMNLKGGTCEQFKITTKKK